MTDHYIRQVKQTFRDFMNHELICSKPFSLTDEELWRGIKERSNNRPHHVCDFINRMNRYCTLVTVSGHISKSTPHTKYSDFGVFKYTYNESSYFEILYHTLYYQHTFHDEGMIKISFSGNGNPIYTTYDIINDGRRLNCTIQPESIFEEPSNIGCCLFLEYSIQGINDYGSLKYLPSFVMMDDTDSFFLKEVRNSLLKTKVVLLSLVEKFPTHLMPQLPSNLSQNDSNAFKPEFMLLYEQEVSRFIKETLSSSKQDLENLGVPLVLPF